MLKIRLEHFSVRAILSLETLVTGADCESSWAVYFRAFLFFCRKMNKNCFEVDKVMAVWCNGCGNSPRGEPLSRLAFGLDFGLDFRLADGKAYGNGAQRAISS